MLTDTFIKSFRPAPLPKKYFDGNGTGLHLICNPGGKKTFAIKNLHPVTRREQPLNVGEYPSTTLKDARDQAINTRVVLAQGIDPPELRAQARVKEKATIVDTFKNLGRDWMQFAVRVGRTATATKPRLCWIDNCFRRSMHFPSRKSQPGNC